MAKEFIDLGLPSGNLWATENEVAENGQPLYATFDEAVKQFGENLPTQEDWQELIDNVPHLWDKKRQGLLFVARNGNELFLPAKTAKSYWTSSKEHKDFAFCYVFWANGACELDCTRNIIVKAVRLIKKGGKQ